MLKAVRRTDFDSGPKLVAHAKIDALVAVFAVIELAVLIALIS